MNVRQKMDWSKRLLVFGSLSLAATCGAQGDRATTKGETAEVADESRPVAESGHAAVTGKVPAPSAVVVLSPTTGPVMRPPTDSPVMDQKSLTFWPGTLLVRTGQPVKFANSDPELHNINVKESRTREQSFNVAIPTGQSYWYTFKRDGFYDVRCDIHAAMAAAIVVTSSPYAVVADSAGNFTFEDVPPGSYAMTIYTGWDTIVKPITVRSPHTEVELPVGPGN